MKSTIRNASAAVAIAAATTLGAVGCTSEDMEASDTQAADTSAAQTTEPAQSDGNEASTAGEDSPS